MKYRITFKTADAVDQSKEEAEKLMKECLEKSEDELYEEMAVYEDLLNKYVKYGEMVTIEFDTDEQTVTVVEV